jgi:hypothetical protein
MTNHKINFTCEFKQAIFKINTNTVTTYQWQVSTDGINWSTIVTTRPTGATTNTLSISSVTTTL